MNMVLLKMDSLTVMLGRFNWNMIDALNNQILVTGITHLEIASGFCMLKQNAPRREMEETENNG